MKSAVNASTTEGEGMAVFGVCGVSVYTKIS